MLERFYPKAWRDSTYQIPWEAWYGKGIRGAIFDIDNTLVRHDQPADERAVALFQRLHALGIRTCLLSPYIYKSGKPGVAGYQKAMKLMGTDESTTLFVGDQLFTDIYGANRAGIYSILVKPIHPKEEIQIVVKRYLEVVVLHFYRKSLRNSSGGI